MTDPARSWSIGLQDGRLVWRGHVEGQMCVLHSEPGASLVRRILARALGWLPIEAHL